VTRIIVAGGHSAGHIEPALAVADAIRALDPSVGITALGTRRGLDTTLIPGRGYDLELIPPVPLPRRLNADLVRTPIRLGRAVRATGAVLDRLHPDALLGFGSYVALPGYLAARRRKIPVIVHEANAHPGVANRLAARFTPYVFTAAPNVHLPHATAIGIPLRPQIAELDRRAARPAARAALRLRQDLPTLLVTGGSQGARRINAAVLGSAAALARAGVQVVHIAGPKNTDVVAPDIEGGPAYRVLPYLAEMETGYAAADMVLCRSGAMTCAELTAVGLPAAYVPLPLRGGEQRLNAEPIVAAGGGLLVADEDCTPEWLQRTIIPTVVDDARLARMSAAAARGGRRDAAQVLARRVLEIAAIAAHAGEES
jgi:UDP-N-acetylglucosamine--N-acetylmuramyl-(pentapeptide) pyrophosphoryl-undecaprenol N-acetylglucosamine transferase